MSLFWLSDYVRVKTTHSCFVSFTPPLFSFPPETLMWITMGQLRTRSAGLSSLLVSRNMLDSTVIVWRSTRAWGLRCVLSGTASYHASSTSPVNITRYCLYFRDNHVLHVLLGIVIPLNLWRSHGDIYGVQFKPDFRGGFPTESLQEFLPLAQKTLENSQVCCCLVPQSLCICSSSSPSFSW